MTTPAHGIDALIADACRRMVQTANLRLQAACDQIEAQIRDDIAELTDAERNHYRAEARDLMRQYGATPAPEPEDVIEDDERWDGGLT